MNIHLITHPVVQKAIEALQAADKGAWLELFTADAQLLDDGQPRDLRLFVEEAFGHERFIRINQVSGDGKDITGYFHSDEWGDFNTYFRFHVQADDKIYKLEIGQSA